MPQIYHVIKKTGSAGSGLSTIHTLEAPKGFQSQDDAHAAGMWAKAALLGDREALQWCLDRQVVTRAQAEAANATGGAVVPSELANAIISLRETYGVTRRFARVVPMRDDTLSIARRIGQATPVFLSEGQAATSQDLTYDSIALTAKKATTFFTVSNELAEDSSADVASDIASEAGEALAQMEDGCALVGDGTSAYGKMRGAAFRLQTETLAGAVACAAGHDTLGEIDMADLTNLLAKLPVRAQRAAAWYCSPLASALVFHRLAAANGGLQTINNELCFCGFPIRLSAVLPAVSTTLASKTMLLFGDLRAIIFGSRREINIARAYGARNVFETDAIALRINERFDTNAHDLGTSATPGALVALIGTA